VIAADVSVSIRYSISGFAARPAVSGPGAPFVNTTKEYDNLKNISGSIETKKNFFADRIFVCYRMRPTGFNRPEHEPTIRYPNQDVEIFF